MARARNLLGDPEEAQDALQDAFCKLWRRHEDIESESQAEGLSTLAVRNVCIDMVRKRRPQADESIESLAETIEDTDPTDHSELLGKVESAISSQLTKRERQILYMRDREGAEIAEIAEIFGLTEANVRLILSRARKKVRECIKDKEL